MDLFSIISVLVVLAAAFGYLNARFLRLPNAIGLMLITIAVTLLIGASGMFYPPLLATARSYVSEIDFEYVLLDVMLGFLLFAGALHTNFDELRTYRWPIMIFATLGVTLSMGIVAALMYLVFVQLGIDVPFLHCLLFGALISPTDPIAVMGILRKANVAKSLELKIVGESLFNDGVGVVLFLTLLNLVSVGAGDPAVGELPHQAVHVNSWTSTLQLLGQEVLGGLLLGLVIGYVTFRMMKAIDDYEIEVILTLACVMGGYTLGHYLHVSAPLAMVVAGLFVGNDLVRGSAMSAMTERYVDKFWELTDMLFNMLLFVLVGMEILVITFKTEYFIATGFAIAIALLARFSSLYLPIGYYKHRLDFAPYTTTIMTWGGLRGGISIALALSLPTTVHRELFLTITYGVVVFSITVQGLTIGPLAQRLLPHGQSLPKH